MGKDMYEGMSALSEETAIIARGMALHKVIRLITMAIGEPVLAIGGPVARCIHAVLHVTRINGWPADLVSTRWPPAGCTHAVLQQQQHICADGSA